MTLILGGGHTVRLLLTVLWSAALSLAQTADDQGFTARLEKMREASYMEKVTIAEQLAQTNHPAVRATLTALIEDRLAYRNSDHRMFVLKLADQDPLILIDPVTMKESGTGPAVDFTTIGTNNALRGALRTTLAQYSLGDKDEAVRLEAVREMALHIGAANAARLRDRERMEKSPTVRSELAIALALYDLDTGDSAARKEAVVALKRSLRGTVRNRLGRVAEEDSDAAVKSAAREAIGWIDLWRKFYSGIEMLFFGISMGSVLVLIATGLAITFGVVRVLNMAHGELMMLGAYTTYVIQTAMPNYIGVSTLVSIPAAFMVSAAVGVLMERCIIRHLYGRPLETLLATFGVGLILQQAVRSLFTSLNRSVSTPQWMSGSLVINDALSVTYNRLYIVLFSFLVFMAVRLILNRTRLGLRIRAVSENRSMAKAMGVRTEWVDAISFGLGSGIAGVAGVALSQLTNVGPNLGQSHIIDSFMVVVFGGVGSLWGALIGGLSMGIGSNLLQPFLGDVLAKIVVLIAIILFIQARPRGLFPQTGRSAEDK
ncbi:MAG: urea ABC transporter permease subunit UrtB [Bryobacteraceae bacterium]